MKGGIRATKDVEGSGTSESKRYLVGPAVEVRLPLRLAIELDALYSRFGLRTFDAGFFGTRDQSWRANSWEFPLLGKFRLVKSVFVEGGYVPRTMSGSTHFDSISVDFAGNRTRQISQQKTGHQVNHRLIAVGCLDLRFGYLRLSPEVRYTRWSNRAFDTEGSHGFFLQSPRNRAEILLGIWWK